MEHEVTMRTEGQAPADYDLVIYRVRIIEERATTSEAKVSCEERSKKLRETLRGLRDKGVTFGGLRSSLSISHNQREGSGLMYRVAYSVTFDSRDLGEVDEVMDALTGELDLVVEAPEFRVTDLKPAQTEALKLAIEESKRRLEEQCNLMLPDRRGMPRMGSPYTVKNWTAHYSDGPSSGKGKGSFLNAVGQSDEVPNEDDLTIKIEPGHAVVSVTLDITWTCE